MVPVKNCSLHLPETVFIAGCILISIAGCSTTYHSLCTLFMIRNRSCDLCGQDELRPCISMGPFLSEDFHLGFDTGCREVVRHNEHNYFPHFHFAPHQWQSFLHLLCGYHGKRFPHFIATTAQHLQAAASRNHTDKVLAYESGCCPP